MRRGGGGESKAAPAVAIGSMVSRDKMTNMPMLINRGIIRNRNWRRKGKRKRWKKNSRSRRRNVISINSIGNRMQRVEKRE